MNPCDILVVIPARGNSKGIPRKNLRLLNGKPLIYYSIKTALSSAYQLDIYVSSDDDEILHISKQFGAKIHKRDLNISDDKTTLDPVIFSCYSYAREKEGKDYKYIITLQPTSPLLKTCTLDLVINKALSDSKIDTVIAAKEDTCLTWKKVNNNYLPNYKKRLNRQYLTPIYKETGAFVITRKDIITDKTRIGKNVLLHSLQQGEEIDIDTYEDFNLCEYYLKRKHVVFVVIGNKKVGLGHVYRTLLLANDIVNHKVTFIVDDASEMAFKKIQSNNYNVKIQKKIKLVDDVIALNPDIVINDILDTQKDYIKKLKKSDFKVINFEDLGEGSRYADIVINSIYSEKKVLKNHFFGQKFFILRDEFMYSKRKKIKKSVKSILITFGGVDPNNYTLKVLKSVYEICIMRGISVEIVTGFGYNNYESLKEFKLASINRNISNISKFMYEADIIFTSAGRTVYEIASIGTPSIVLAQDERELTHFFASPEFGFINLGLGYKVENSKLLNVFLQLINSKSNRVYMNKLMLKQTLTNGRKRVAKIIQRTIESI